MKSREQVDYVFVSDKKKRKGVAPKATRTLIKHKMIGSTSIERVIDTNYQELVTAGRYGQGIE